MPEYSLTLALTIAVELLVTWFVAPRAIRREALPAVLFVNLVTHPIANWLVWNGHATFHQAELLVVLTEFAVLLAIFRHPTTALRIALPTNLATFLLSFAL